MRKDNKEHRYAPPPNYKQNSAGMWVSVDEEQCQQSDIPMLHWNVIRKAIGKINAGISTIIYERQYLIKWLEEKEKRPDVRNSQIERLQQLDSVMRKLYEEREFLKELEKELFYFLPHKGE